MTAAECAEFWREMMKYNARKRGRSIYYTNALHCADLVLRGECSHPGNVPDYGEYQTTSDDGDGNNYRTGQPLKTYQEFLDGFRLDFELTQERRK